MSFKTLILFVVVGGAIVAAHRSYSSPASAAVTAVSNVPGAEGATEAVAGVAARVGDAFGRLGARMAAPVVRSMSKDTRRLLADLDPAIKRAPPHVALKARTLSKQLLKADSTAHQRIADGAPIEAIRYAMFSKGMIPSVRQVVAEETAAIGLGGR
ncbi:hypothetical protein BH23GEM10_BH23GEM10_06350 [soil metagenome]